MSNLYSLATFEDISENGQLGATEAAVASAETATDVAEGTTEQTANVTEIDSADTAIQGAFDGVEDVEKLEGIAEKAQAEGGLTPETAEAIEVSFESIMSGLGMARHTGRCGITPVLSLESYANTNSRAASTVLTIESLREGAKKIITLIINALKAAWNAVSNFFAGLVKNRALMEKHLKNLQAKVKDLGADAVMKNKEISAGAKAFTLNGKANAATANQILDNATSLIVVAVDTAQDVGGFNGQEGWKAQLAKRVEGHLGKMGRGPKVDSGTSFGTLAGGKTVVLDKKTEDGIPTVTIVNVGKAAEKAAALSKNEMDAMVTKALALIQDLRKVESGLSALKKGSEKAVQVMLDQQKAKVEMGRSDDDKAGKEKDDKIMKEQREAARAVANLMGKAGGALPGAAFAAIKGAADYVTGSLNNMGGKADEKKDEKK